jgi:hypothetical protein
VNAADMKQALRVLALVLLLPLVAGFGLCGLLGVVFGIAEGAFPTILFGLIGIPIAIGLNVVCRRIFRALRDRAP